ncbi:MAG: hypothetical protein JST70_17260 [Bacteroidetes bacterium]|nr:hypothetical protein [Bacteroidota bacterium]
MTRKLLPLFIILLYLQCNEAYSQSPHNSVTDYDYYTPADREPIYHDEFNAINDNNKDWINNDDPFFQLKVKDGCLIITNNKTTYTASNYILQFGYLRDFELEICARVESPKRRERHGILFWGSDSAITQMNGQFFYFRHGQHMLFNKTGKEQRNNSLPVPDFTFYDKKDFNIYTIRKVDYDYYLFINHVFCNKYPYFPINGQLIGLGASSNGTTAYYDYIHIDYLKRHELNNPTAEYKSGTAGLKTYLNEHLKFTQTAAYECMRGRFLVRYRVDTTGKIDSIIALSAYDILNQQTIKALTETNNNWLPAHHKGVAMVSWNKMVVEFRLNSNGNCPQPTYYYDIAMKYYKEGNIPETIENFKISIGEDFADIKSLYNLSMLYINQQQYDSAAIYLNRINELRSIPELDIKQVNEEIAKTDADIYIKQYCKL